MVAVIILIVAITFTAPLKSQITDTMNSTNLDCDNSSITTNEKIVCNIVDMTLFYFIGVCIAIAIALVAGQKNITGVITAIMVFIVVVLLISPLKDLLILFRDSDHLNCGAAGLSVGNGLLCIFVDLWLFYFIVVAITAGATLVASKYILPPPQE
jgi:hypothetical protein